MGKSIVNIVVDALNNAGISAQRAMPASRMCVPVDMAAAVQLQKLDQAGKTATVLVSVLIPASAGASGCEDSALRICRILQGTGGVCRLEQAEYRSDMDLFCAAVYADFAGQEAEQGWIWYEQPAGFLVAVGDVQLSNVISFTAQRAVDETVAALSDALWYFRLEELFPPDGAEEDAPSEPFSITVSRQGRTETYSGCTVTSHKRSITGNGQQQIREGVAAERTVS